MPSCCVVINCKNKYTHNKHVSFHKFPHHKLILMKWIDFTGRKDWFPSRWSSICSRHFLANDFRQHKSRKCLRPGAIPTISPNEEETQNQTKSNLNNSDGNLKEQRKTISNQPVKKVINKKIQLNSKEFECNNAFSNNISQFENLDKEVMNTEIKGRTTNQNSLDVSNAVISLQIVCRLCGLNNSPLLSQVPCKFKNREIFDMIEKCFPTLNIQLNDHFQAEICEDCLNNLKEFSHFTKIVQRQQRNVLIEANNTNHSEEKIRQPTKNIFNNEKNTTNINIKQEPTLTTYGIKVKQEISETSSCLPINSSPLTNIENVETEFEQQQNNELIDQKSSQILNIPLISTEKGINNCDVMEIISLDDAFIELLDDDVNIENNGDDPRNEIHPRNNENCRIPAEAKIENCDYIDKYANFNLSIYNICEEHNYTRLNSEISESYKQENIENESKNLNKNIVTFSSQVQTKKSAGIIVLDEGILKPAAPFTFGLYICRDCNVPFFFEFHLIEHRRINHPGTTYFCVICNSNFNKYIDLLKHRKICHNFFRKKPHKKLLKCPMCNKKFISKLSLNNHRKYICEFQQKHRIFECKYCQMKLEKWVKLRTHEKKCRIMSKKTLIPPQIIQNSKAAYSTFPSRKIEKITKAFLPLQTLAKKSQIRKMNYTCEICYRSYKNQQHFIRHSFVHTSLKQSNFKCEDCCAIFDHLKDLQNHLGNCKISKKEKSLFICLECGRKYKFLQGLQEHKLKIHSKIKPEYTCTECKKIFNGIRNLRQHMQQHNNVRRMCDFPMCEKTFKQLSGLNQHKKAFHLNMKPYQCPVCQRKYALKGDMTRCRHSDRRLRHLKGYLLNEDNND